MLYRHSFFLFPLLLKHLPTHNHLPLLSDVSTLTPTPVHISRSSLPCYHYFLCPSWPLCQALHPWSEGISIGHFHSAKSHLSYQALLCVIPSLNVAGNRHPNYSGISVLSIQVSSQPLDNITFLLDFYLLWHRYSLKQTTNPLKFVQSFMQNICNK